jgi:hypothetical protein
LNQIDLHTAKKNHGYGTIVINMREKFSDVYDAVLGLLAMRFLAVCSFFFYAADQVSDNPVT